MKNLLFVLTVFFMIGCTDSKEYCLTYHYHKVVEIDSCEYVLVTVSTEAKYYSDIIHKGNCKFCEERQKKFYTEIVDSMFMMQD